VVEANVYWLVILESSGHLSHAQPRPGFHLGRKPATPHDRVQTTARDRN